MKIILPIRKKILYTLLITSLLLSASNVFAATGQIMNSNDIMAHRQSSSALAKVIVLNGDEKIETPYDGLMDKTEFFPVNKITSPIVFKKGLFITEYNKLLREKLMEEYPKAFKNKVINEFFFKALAERTYSYNGYLSEDFFNEVVNERAVFYRIRHHIMQQKLDRLIKISLMYLYLIESVYYRNIKNPNIAIEKLNKLPKYPVLYIIDPPKFLVEAEEKLMEEGKYENRVDYSQAVDQFDNPVFGKYVNFDMGENLYYICANFYPDFVNLPPNRQLKILNELYEFNITLTEAPPIRADSSLVSYIKEQFNAIERDRFLKYRLKTNETWLLLPRSLSIYTENN